MMHLINLLFIFLVLSSVGFLCDDHVGADYMEYW